MPVRGVAFDAFGTLFDLEGLAPRVREALGEAGDDVFAGFLARLVPWTWHATAAEHYRPFPEMAALALHSAALERGIELSEATAEELASGLAELPAFPDAERALLDLEERGLSLAVLSNGTPEGVRGLVEAGGLGERFAHLLAADEVRRFKPAPEVYAMGSRAFGVEAGEVLMVSGNDWDVAGAAHAGLRTAWIARGRPVTRALGIEPDAVADELADLPGALRAAGLV